MMQTIGSETNSVVQRLPQMRVPVSLRQLLPTASFVGCADIRVTEATAHSDDCRPNVLFAAVTGSREDGTNYVDEAVAQGADALLIDKPLAHVAVPQCVVPGVRSAYARLCAALDGWPSRRLWMSGVTGTNGKTTVAWLIRSILETSGRQTGLLGTIEYNDGALSATAGLTTPDAKTLSAWLSRMVRRGSTHASIELSSHALDQHRAEGIELDVALVTNVTHDHFDYHENHETYLAAKARITRHLAADGLLVINADDPGSAALRKQVAGTTRTVTYGIDFDADVTASIVQETVNGTRFILTLPENGGSVEVTTRLTGRHNVSNCLAAATAAWHGGVDCHAIADGIQELRSVPGRLERIHCGQPFDVFVDYAHTDDALRRCLGFLKRLTRGRLICVFGAGGDRDRSKRPLLGNAALDADLAVLTSDNPRSEDPEQIIRDILPGLDDGRNDLHVEVDRAEAIHWALEHAEPGDCVLVAGKGHETEQIVGSERLPFDDREVVRRVLRHLAEHADTHSLRKPA